MAIIGILATLIVGGFRSSQRRARDAARKSDLSQIAKALEMFYSDYQTYPSSDDKGRIMACPYSGASSTPCEYGKGEMTDTDEKTIYMRTVPADHTAGGKYFYKYLSSKKGFQIFAHLENSEDQNCINSECSDTTGLATDLDCGDGFECNFAVTSANVTAKDQ
jgi:type II secretory pathway pseudopilin PulG